jgi:hypothetical protein
MNESSNVKELRTTKHFAPLSPATVTGGIIGCGCETSISLELGRKAGRMLSAAVHSRQFELGRVIER